SGYSSDMRGTLTASLSSIASVIWTSARPASLLSSLQLTAALLSTPAITPLTSSRRLFPSGRKNFSKTAKFGSKVSKRLYERVATHTAIPVGAVYDRPGICGYETKAASVDLFGLPYLFSDPYFAPAKTFVGKCKSTQGVCCFCRAKFRLRCRCREI